jgi:hypothetical protein
MSHTSMPHTISHVTTSPVTTSRMTPPHIVPNAIGLKSASSPQRLFGAAELLFPQNDNFADDGPCPICHGQAEADRPTVDFRGGQLRRRWQCCACGHHWTTTRRVQN